MGMIKYTLAISKSNRPIQPNQKSFFISNWGYSQSYKTIAIRQEQLLPIVFEEDNSMYSCRAL